MPVLVVDDQPRNLRLLRLLLEGEGFDVRTAATGAEALAALREFLPRVVLLDIQLPDMDGYEVARRIRADDRLRDVPVLAVTSFASAADGAEALAAGCDDWVAKPIDTRSFAALVARHATSGRAPAPPAPAGRDPP